MSAALIQLLLDKPKSFCGSLQMQEARIKIHVDNGWRVQITIVGMLASGNNYDGG